MSFVRVPFHFLKISFIEVFQLPVSNFDLVHIRRPADRSCSFREKDFSIAEKSPLVSLRSFSLALRHWRATLIIRYRTGGGGMDGGTEGGEQEGAWNEESGSMLGQHIKIMASIGADAPYIPIRGKGLRLISIASRYPSPGVESERALAYTRTRA